MNISIDLLLKFISEFSVTLIFCIIGSWTRAIVKSSKNKNKMDLDEIIISTIFSAFLMCSGAQYIHLPFEVYATLSIICGMWGKVFINLLVSERFMRNLIGNLTKLIKSDNIREVVDDVIDAADEATEIETLDNNIKNDTEEIIEEIEDVAETTNPKQLPSVITTNNVSEK